MAGSMITFASNGGEAKGYLSLPPSGSGPGLLVIQEWWGLVQHIKNMADRYAARGFVALAPDLYHGESTTEPDHAMTLMHELEIPQASKDLIGAANYLRSHNANSTGKVGCLGYCMGGGMTLLLASKGAIDAAAPFYGVLPSGLPDADSIQCAVQGHFAEHDDATAAVPGLRDGLTAAGVENEFFIYDGTEHAFCNDERPEVYDEAAATLSMEPHCRLHDETPFVSPILRLDAQWDAFVTTSF